MSMPRKLSSSFLDGRTRKNTLGKKEAATVHLLCRGTNASQGLC